MMPSTIIADPIRCVGTWNCSQRNCRIRQLQTCVVGHARNDCLSVTDGSRHTGLGGTVRDRSDVRPGPIAGPPDIRLVQTCDSTAQITSGAYDFDVAIVAFRQEPAWTG